MSELKDGLQKFMNDINLYIEQIKLNSKNPIVRKNIEKLSKELSDSKILEMINGFESAEISSVISQMMPAQLKFMFDYSKEKGDE
jgi:hypothetical protein